MKASELIKEFEKIIEVEGDLEVGAYDGEYGSHYVINKVTVENNYNICRKSYSDDDIELGKRFISIMGVNQ